MTEDTGDLTQIHAMACREYTLPREDDASQPSGWIQGNTKIGPFFEVATNCLHGECGVEIGIESVNKVVGQNFSRIEQVGHGLDQQGARRDEKVLRTWDVLADEDHTHHMSEEEYFHHKNKC